MRYSYLIALATWVAMPTVSTRADEPTADQRLAARRGSPAVSPPTDQPPPAGVFSEGGLARFRLRLGRLQVDPMRYRKGSETFCGTDFRETLSVANASGVPSVYYRFEDDFQRIQLTAEHGKSLRIESTLNATGEQAVLVQHEDGRVSWATRRNPHAASPADVRAGGPTLLHVIGMDEAGFRLHLDSLTSRMLRGRSLIAIARQTEAYMLGRPDRLPAISRDRVLRLVDQLGSRTSASRRSAMKQLAEMGTAVTPHLTAALGRPDLDAEQIARIEQLLSRPARCDEDTPASLACLLSADRAHWQMMARRMNRSEWLAANDHVRRCGLDTLTR